MTPQDIQGWIVRCSGGEEDALEAFEELGTNKAKLVTSSDSS